LWVGAGGICKLELGELPAVAIKLDALEEIAAI
jgi:hypothetical protein